MNSRKTKVKEKWKPIPNYEDYYLISSFGRIKSKKRTVPHPNGDITLKSKKMTLTENSSGYLQVKLNKNGKSKRFYVHRLVVSVFITNEFDEVNHIDGNKYNNSVENLEPCSRRQNYKHAVNKGLIQRDNFGKFK